MSEFVDQVMSQLNAAMFEACDVIAPEMRDDLVARISTQGGKKRHASKGSYPFRQSGRLISEIRVKVTRGDDEATIMIVSGASYSTDLEYGWTDAKGVDHGPFPFMMPFFDDWADGKFVYRLDAEMDRILNV